MHPMLILSKKPEMLNNRRVPMLPVACMAWMQWTRVVTAFMVVWWSLNLNCNMGMSWLVSMSIFTHFTTIFSISLPVHSSKLMGRYAFAWL